MHELILVVRSRKQKAVPVGLGDGAQLCTAWVILLSLVYFELAEYEAHSVLEE